MPVGNSAICAAWTVKCTAALVALQACAAIDLNSSVVQHSSFNGTQAAATCEATMTAFRAAYAADPSTVTDVRLCASNACNLPRRSDARSRQATTWGRVLMALATALMLSFFFSGLAA